MALMADGVHWDLATANSTKYVLVSQQAHETQYVMNGVAWERVVYEIRATCQGSSAAEVKQAARRIHELLEDGTLTIDGYYPPMLMRRVQRIRRSEPSQTTGLRWHHRGGQYEVLVTPI
jgi:hypothetical protein